jgi:hypothetical protein
MLSENNKKNIYASFVGFKSQSRSHIYEDKYFSCNYGNEFRCWRPSNINDGLQPKYCIVKLTYISNNELYNNLDNFKFIYKKKNILLSDFYDSHMSKYIKSNEWKVEYKYINLNINKYDIVEYIKNIKNNNNNNLIFNKLEDYINRNEELCIDTIFSLINDEKNEHFLFMLFYYIIKIYYEDVNNTISKFNRYQEQPYQILINSSKSHNNYKIKYKDRVLDKQSNEGFCNNIKDTLFTNILSDNIINFLMKNYKIIDNFLFKYLEKHHILYLYNKVKNYNNDKKSSMNNDDNINYNFLDYYLTNGNDNMNIYNIKFNNNLIKIENEYNYIYTQVNFVNRHNNYLDNIFVIKYLINKQLIKYIIHYDKYEITNIYENLNYGKLDFKKGYKNCVLLQNILLYFKEYSYINKEYYTLKIFNNYNIWYYGNLLNKYNVIQTNNLKCNNIDLNNIKLSIWNELLGDDNLNLYYIRLCGEWGLTKLHYYLYVNKEFYKKYLCLNDNILNFSENKLKDVTNDLSIMHKKLINYLYKLDNQINQTVKLDTILDNNNHYQPWNETNTMVNYKFNKKINSKLKKILDNHPINLFDYQKENIVWMNDIEKKVINNKHYIRSYKLKYIIDLCNNLNTKDNNFMFEYINNTKLSIYFEISKDYNLLNQLIYDNDGEYLNDYVVLIMTINYKNPKLSYDYNNLGMYDYFSKQNDIYTKYFVIDKKFYNDEKLYNYSLMNINSSNNIYDYLLKQIKLSQKIYLRGGFLCDDVGLGKTVSSMTYCLYKMEEDKKTALPFTNNSIIMKKPITYDFTDNKYLNKQNKWVFNNLIIIPTRLIKQWVFEIEKYSSNLERKPIILTLSTVTNIKNFVKKNQKLVDKGKDIIRPDIIIMSINIINNNNYLKYLIENYDNFNKNISNGYNYNVTDYFDIFQIWWNRIIIDEIHETVNLPLTKKNNKVITKKKREMMYTIITLLNSNFKWGLTATPIESKEGNIMGYINWQSDLLKVFNNNIYSSMINYDNIIENFYSYKIVRFGNIISENYDKFTIKLKCILEYFKNIENYKINKKFVLTLPIIDYMDINENKNIIIYNNNTTNKYKSDDYNYIKEIYNQIKKINSNNKYYGKFHHNFGINNNLLDDTNFKFLNNSLKYFNNEELNKFIKKSFTKTTKSLVSDKLGIPIFTEEIKLISLTNVEKNIYNNIKHEVSTYINDNISSLNNTQTNKIKLLFQVCTNVLISNSEHSNITFNENKLLTLEQINEKMTNIFKGKLKYSINEKNKILKFIDNFNIINIILNIITKVIKNKYNRQISNTTIKDILYTTITKFNEVIKKLKNNKVMDYSRYVNSADYASFQEYQIIDIEFNSFIDNLSFKLPLDKWKTRLENDNLIDKTDNNDIIENLLSINEKETYIETLINNNIDIFKNIINNLAFRWDVETISINLFDQLVKNKKKNMSISLKNANNKLSELNNNIRVNENQIKLFNDNDYIKEKTNDPCIICLGDFEDDMNIVIAPCRHIVCGDCFSILSKNKSTYPCPECRQPVNKEKVNVIPFKNVNTNQNEDNNDNTNNDNTNNNTNDVNQDNLWEKSCINKYGSKMTQLVKILKNLFSVESENNRVIIFSQYDNMLKLIGITLDEFKIKYCRLKGNIHSINKNIDKFKRDQSIRVIMLSSENSNSGCNLTEANTIIFVDVINGNKDLTRDVEAQAIGRSVRLGQNKPVKLIRLITKNTIEEDTYNKNKYDIKDIQ